MAMRPWTPDYVKILNDAHIEQLRGGPRPQPRRRPPRPN
jgi:hypothetical protein